MLEADYAKRVREATTARSMTSLVDSGQPWLEATDHFYMYERVQRWAGVTDTAVCLDRRTVNPMLDRDFLDLVVALPLGPSPERGSSPRSSVSWTKSSGGCPSTDAHPPEVYGDPTGWRRLLRLSTTFRKGVQKVGTASASGNAAARRRRVARGPPRRTVAC